MRTAENIMQILWTPESFFRLAFLFTFARWPSKRRILRDVAKYQRTKKEPRYVRNYCAIFKEVTVQKPDFKVWRTL